MTDPLIHRGPDAQGLHADGGRLVGRRRLSITDPQGGDPPIYSAGGRLAVCANGEIYNYPQLREELSTAHRFRTGNDSESALHLYEEIADRMAEQLDGMFALVIIDGQELHVARDTIGIKPLYVGRRGDALAFAPESKALAGVAAHVEQFPAGTCFHTRLGRRQFYAVPRAEPLDLPVDEHASRLRATLERAVGKRLISDVPVGAFLSGGLDSSIIAAIARRHVDEPHTFTVGVEGTNDLQAARTVAEHLDTVHHEYIPDPQEVKDALPEIIFHLESYDQDLVRSAIPCYFTSRPASRYVKVILTGEGADELFAGYTYYKDVRGPNILRDELRRSICSPHNINLQRVDRMTMAHSIEGRVPFPDTEMIRLGMEIPPELKLRTRPDGRAVEKWILRKACEDLLPEEILWRDKQQFDEGGGTVDLLAAGLDEFLPAEGSDSYRNEHSDAQLRSAEERAYHKLLTEACDDPHVVLSNVARWSRRPENLETRP